MLFDYTDRERKVMMVINVCFHVLKIYTGGGASDKIHKAIKRCIGHVPGVTSGLTPSGIHDSAAYQMAQHPILNIYRTIVRVCWFFEGESCLFY